METQTDSAERANPKRAPRKTKQPQTEPPKKSTTSPKGGGAHKVAKLVKGSEEAKQHMAMLRSKKKNVKKS